jgi:hypothetical protein
MPFDIHSSTASIGHQDVTRLLQLRHVVDRHAVRRFRRPTVKTYGKDAKSYRMPKCLKVSPPTQRDPLVDLVGCPARTLEPLRLYCQIRRGDTHYRGENVLCCPVLLSHRGLHPS